MTASEPDSTMSGINPRKTKRHELISAILPAITGPMTPGRTHAVESVANICARRPSGSVRPIAT